MRRIGAAVRLAGALCLAAACEHTQPFGAADLGPNVPFSAALPRQLTFSPLGDLAPAWLPDGSAILYSYQRLDRPDHDRCLGLLPAEGGQIVRSICHRPANDAYFANTLWEPAAGPGGALAYLRESSPVGAPAPQSRELVAATLDEPDPGRVLLRFPYTAADSTVHGTAAYLHWVDSTTLVFLAEQVTYTTPPLPRDTLYAPIEIVELSVAADTVAVTLLPGTGNATSVTTDGAGAIYYTRAGDSYVYRIPRGGSGASPISAFATLGPVSDVQVHGNTLVVVAGGALYRADLAGSIVVRGSVGVDSIRLARPALSPSGDRIATQGFRGTQASNLWLFGLP